MKDKKDRHVILSLKCPFLKNFWIYLRTVNVLKTNTHRVLGYLFGRSLLQKHIAPLHSKHGLEKIPSSIYKIHAKGVIDKINSAHFVANIHVLVSLQ